MTDGASPSGWYQDPTGEGDSRYWNGTSWTESVNRGGVTVNVAIDSSQALVPPVPGTQVAPPSPSAPPSTVNVSPSNRSPIGAIFGALAVVLAIVVILVVLNNSDSSDDDTPTPGTDAPAEQPAEEPAPADTGG